MDKLKMHSPDMTQENIKKIQALFPNCVTEVRDENGKLRLAIDFDQLKQELSDSIVEGPQERYHLNWPGKRESLLASSQPISNTLRPSVEESKNFDSTANLFLEGDNLDALKLLQESYLNKVKLIYIDPPYNTGSDFIYEDDFTESSASFLTKTSQVSERGDKLTVNRDSSGRFHSAWLSMMYSRLKLSRNLLCDDGVIFISLDDHEIDNLRKLCDEIFGRNNFVANVVWQRAFSPKNDARYLSENHDYILIYAKNLDSFSAGRLPRTEEANARYKNLDNDPRGVWISDNLTVKTYSEKYDFPIETPSGRVVTPSHGSCWRVSKEKFEELVKDNRIWFGNDGGNVPRLKRFLSEVQGGMVPTTLWLHQDVGHNQEGRQEVKALFDGRGYFDGPKPVRLMKRILQIANTSDNDIILDFFGGSGSTAHASMQLNAEDGHNRKFIIVQLAEKCDETSEAYKAGFETIADISKERIRRAGSKILDGECHKDWNKDVGFRVLKVDTSNMSDVFYTPNQTSQSDLDLLVDHIKPDRTDEDLLFQVLLDAAVDLALPITLKEVCGKPVYFVDENAFVACFAQGINENLVKELASFQPLQVVFRDDAFESNAMKINAEQIFKQLSPNTVVKAI